MKDRKIAGILGGMGPEATVDLMRRIVKYTSADDDFGHVHCLVDQNPHVPSRIKVLLEGGNVSPGPCMVDMARKLQAGGADFLCIACNTAHNWYGDVAEAVFVPVLNMVELASEAAARKLENKSSQRRVGILASPAVRLTKLYEGPCQKLGLIPVFADERHEQALLDVIKSIKAGDTGPETQAAFSAIVRHLRDAGAHCLIVACTELGILKMETVLPVVDAADALALAIIDRAGAVRAPDLA